MERSLIEQPHCQGIGIEDLRLALVLAHDGHLAIQRHDDLGLAHAEAEEKWRIRFRGRENDRPIRADEVVTIIRGHDALGSVANLTDAAGAIQARYIYDAWGNHRRTAGQSPNPFGFTGHERDDETGLYYARARYYDPEIGIFLTQDSSEGSLDTPPSLHRYLYVFANPTTGIDPDGRERVEVQPETKKETKIQKKYRKAVEEFKKAPGGAEAFEKLEESEEFTLVVEYDAEYEEGLVVGDYEFDEEGNLRKATLVVGPNFRGNIGDEEDYPFGSTVRKKKDRMIYLVAHEEQGHFMLAVEDPEYGEILRDKEQLNREVQALREQAQEKYPDEPRKWIAEYQRLLAEEGINFEDLEEMGRELENRSDEVGQTFVEAAREDEGNGETEEEEQR